MAPLGIWAVLRLVGHSQVVEEKVACKTLRHGHQEENAARHFAFCTHYATDFRCDTHLEIKVIF